MKKIFCTKAVLVLLLYFGLTGQSLLAIPTVTLSTPAIAPGNILQGSNNNILYILQMDAATDPATFFSLQFTITGTHDNNDISSFIVFVNSAPNLTGAFFLGSAAGSFAAPHTYSVFTGNTTVPAGSTRYIIITAFADAAATHNNTVKIDGLINPVTFDYTVAPVLINNQANNAGLQTIKAADVSYSTIAVPAGDLLQGSTNNVIYILKTDVNNFDVFVQSISFTVTGTMDNNDITGFSVLVNSNPTTVGAGFFGFAAGSFSAPHTYNISTGGPSIPAGSSRYFIIVANIDGAATNNNTVKINGAVNPVTLTYNTSPNITNGQADNAGVQTIRGAEVTYSTNVVPSGSLLQGSTNNVIYILKADASNFDVVVQNINFTVSGTVDNNDIGSFSVLVNNIPSITGALFLGSTPGTFSAPHSYSVFTGGPTIVAGTTRYFIIAANVDASATAAHTVKINGAADPVVLVYANSPAIVNNQSDNAGAFTITSLLPVSLLSFTAENRNSYINLRWSTAGEMNSREFIVEHSNNGRDFSALATIAAAGNSSSIRNYSYDHTGPGPALNYYRLRMIDQDGRFTYSPVIKVMIAADKNKIVAFPNPVIDLLHLQVGSEKNKTIVFSLYSADGKMIASRSFTLTKGTNLLSWSLEQLAKGSYFISSNSNDHERILVVKK